MVSIPYFEAKAVECGTALGSRRMWINPSVQVSLVGRVRVSLMLAGFCSVRNSELAQVLNDAKDDLRMYGGLRKNG